MSKTNVTQNAAMSDTNLGHVIAIESLVQTSLEKVIPDIGRVTTEVTFSNRHLERGWAHTTTFFSPCGTSMGIVYEGLYTLEEEQKRLETDQTIPEFVADVYIKHVYNQVPMTLKRLLSLYVDLYVGQTWGFTFYAEGNPEHHTRLACRDHLRLVNRLHHADWSFAAERKRFLKLASLAVTTWTHDHQDLGEITTTADLRRVSKVLESRREGDERTILLEAFRTINKFFGATAAYFSGNWESSFGHDDGLVGARETAFDAMKALTAVLSIDEQASNHVREALRTVALIDGSGEDLQNEIDENDHHRRRLSNIGPQVVRPIPPYLEEFVIHRESDKCSWHPRPQFEKLEIDEPANPIAA